MPGNDIVKLGSDTSETMCVMHRFPTIASVVCFLTSILLKGVPEKQSKTCDAVIKVYFLNDRRDFRISLDLSHAYACPENYYLLQKACEMLTHICHSINITVKCSSNTSKLSFVQTKHSIHSVPARSTFLLPENSPLCVIDVHKAFYPIPVRYEACLHEGDNALSEVINHLSVNFANITALEIYVCVKRQSDSWFALFRRPKVNNTCQGVAFALSSSTSDWHAFFSTQTIFRMHIHCELVLCISAKLKDRRNRKEIIVLNNKEMRETAFGEGVLERIRSKLPGILHISERYDASRCISWFAFMTTEMVHTSFSSPDHLKETHHAVALTVLNTFQKNMKTIRQMYFENVKHSKTTDLHQQNELQSSQAMIPKRSLIFAPGKQCKSQNMLRSLEKDVISIGQFANAAILCYSPLRREIFIIDQHAADERIRYEKFKGLFSQMLRRTQLDCAELVSNIPLALLQNFHKTRVFLARWGFEAGRKGENEILVQSVPNILFESEATTREVQFQPQDVVALLDEVHNTGILDTDRIPKIFDDKLILRSCRGAIMFGGKLSRQKSEAIINDLRETKHPFACSHGRQSMTVLLKIPLAYLL